MSKTGVRRAMEWFGGEDRMAQECRVSVYTVRLWVQKGRAPKTAARLISILTGIGEKDLR